MFNITFSLNKLKLLSIFLFLIIFFLGISLASANTVYVCAPAADNCFEYPTTMTSCTSKGSNCAMVQRNIVNVGDSYQESFFLCASKIDSNGCYNLSGLSSENCLKKLDVNKNSLCKFYSFSAEQIGQADNKEQRVFPLSPFPTLTNPLSSVKSPQGFVGKIINAVMGVVGSLALLMLIFGGLTWMTAGGSQEKVKKGVDIIIWSTLGLAVIFLSYVLVKFLLDNVI